MNRSGTESDKTLFYINYFMFFCVSDSEKHQTCNLCVISLFNHQVKGRISFRFIDLKLNLNFIFRCLRCVSSMCRLVTPGRR